MQCEQFEATWQRLLDERRSPQADPHLLAHSLICPKCADLLDSSHALQCGLDIVTHDDLPADFAEQAVARAVVSLAPERANTKSASKPAVKKTAWWLLAAAALLMAAASQYPENNSSHTLAVRTEAEPTAPADTIPTPVEQEELQLRELLADLAERFPKDEATKAITTHIQRLDSATRPLARSFGTAFTAIYRSVGKSVDSNKSAHLAFASRNIA